jgi:hypothetical protein
MARASAVVLLGTMLAELFAAGLYVRYWLPILAVLQLPIAALCERPLSTRRGPVALVLLTLAASLLLVRKGLAVVQGDLTGLVAAAFDIEDRRAFLVRHLPLLPIYEQVNRDLPPEARIALNGYCGGFYLDRTTFCVDFPQEALRSTTWSEFVADVRRLGVTHVITLRSLATDAPLPLPDYSSAAVIQEGRNHELVRRLITGHARLLAAASDEGLYELQLDDLR